MKKISGMVIDKMIAIICTICLLFLFSTVTANAQTTTKITASSCTVERGDVASVAFNLSGNPGIWAIKLRIHYDASALTLKSVNSGTVFNEGEFMFSESLNKNPYIVTAHGSQITNKTKNGTIVTLNFVVNSNASFKSYPITMEISQIINVDQESISAKAVDGSVSVIKCNHSEKEWRVTSKATCEKAGKEALICKKCGTVFETRKVEAIKHKNTVVRNMILATKTHTGYTGDTYCKDCGKLISTGSVIAKLSNLITTTTNSTTTSSTAVSSTNSTQPSESDKPEMMSGNDLTFVRNSNKSLVFVSDADISDFIKVEIDSTVLEEKDYTLKSGSTIITVNANFLNKLSDGVHTVSIVSKSGVADTQFTVQNEIDTTITTTSSDNYNADTKSKSSGKLIFFMIVAAVILGGVAAFFVFKRRRR